jgi:hypothetical protein
MAGSLNEVVKKLEEQRAAIEKALTALRELESPGIAPADSPRRGRPPKRKGGMTPAGRRRLSEALRARWAAKKAASAVQPAKVAKPAKAARPAKTKAKGGITAAGRKKLSEALKARWAAKRAAATKKK